MDMEMISMNKCKQINTIQLRYTPIVFGNNDQSMNDELNNTDLKRYLLNLTLINQNQQVKVFEATKLFLTERSLDYYLTYKFPSLTRSSLTEQSTNDTSSKIHILRGLLGKCLFPIFIEIKCI
jgi:hypothetical protein